MKDKSFKSEHYSQIEDSLLRITIVLKTIVLIILINCILSANVYGQSNDLRFDHLSIEDGLSQATVWAIIQDSQGFMWFGTADGLNKYDGYSFTLYTHDPRDSISISDSRILTLLEDRSGTLWIGTSGGGLNRFDRKKEKFTHYKHDPSNAHSLSHNRVLSIYEDRSGTLWIGTAGGGLNKFDRETNRFEHYKHDPGNPNSLSNDHVFPICEDTSGTLWIGTIDGLNKFEKEHKKFTHFKHDPARPSSLSQNVINAIYADKYGTLWIGTDNGLNTLVLSETKKLVSWASSDSTEGKNEASTPMTTRRNSSKQDSALALLEAREYEGAQVKFMHYKHNPKNPNSLNDNIIWSIYEDKSGTLWIGTAKGGLSKFDREKETFINYKKDPLNRYSLSDNRVRCIFEDRSRVLWVGTNGGGVNKVNRLRNKFVHYKHNPTNSNSLSNNRVYSIYQDKTGVFWIGTSGGGLNKFDRIRETFVHYKNDPSNPYSLSYDIVLSIHEDNAGVLWIGTSRGGLNKFDREKETFVQYKNDPSNPHSVSGNSIRCIFEDKFGLLWIGTNGEGLNKFERKRRIFTHYKHDPQDPNSLSSDIVRSIYEDHSGTLWIGTYGGGLDKVVQRPDSSGEGLDQVKETFAHYRHDPANPNSLNSNYVLCIYEDPADKGGSTLWIGTHGGGLNKFDKLKEEFTYFTVKDGLPNNVVYGILSDKHGNLWLSTNKGLSKFNPQTENFRNYDVNDGLQSNEFNTGAYFRSRSGEMFFGGINGFNAFYPEEITDSPYIPPVVISRIKKFDEDVRFDISETEEIELSYTDKYLAFEFVALDYTNPQKNRYAYMMAGFDEDWNYSGTKRFATYTNLDPGEYVFSVKGSNSDGVWNEEAISIKIIITPPFWQAWWFKILVGASVLAMAFGWYKRRIKSIEVQKQKLEIQVRQKTKEIQETQTQLVQSEKMAALGKLTAGIAHEINNPVGTLKSNIDVEIRCLAKLEKILKNVKTSQAIKSSSDYKKLLKILKANVELSSLASERIAKIVTSLKNFTRMDVAEFDRVNIHDGLESTLTLIQHEIRDGIDIVRDYGEIPKIDCHPGELNQVFMTLLQNSLQAIEKNGIVTIRTWADEKNVYIKISDTGRGIPQEKIETLFDLNFTTKGSRVGIGLGLPHAYNIIRKHNGEIKVESETGRGTEVTIILPQ